MEGFGVADDDDEAFGAGDGGVEDVALEHEVVLGGDGQDERGVFAALGFVDGDGVGEAEVVEVVEINEVYAVEEVNEVEEVDRVDVQGRQGQHGR